MMVIYTIGYGRRSLDELAELLSQHTIDLLVDVRSRPYSRWQPDFRKQSLELTLPPRGVGYRFMGDRLGGKPENPQCQRDGRVDHDLIRQQPWFHEAIEELIGLARSERTPAIMCAEQKPQQCHRTWLVAPALLEQDAAVLHIDEHGALQSHEAIRQRSPGRSQRLLFDQ